ncbi:MAG: ribonuclease HI [Chitinophagales bacterium]|jgi:ribonuclease HI|nr:ribonuclease HI [Chitinophagales bacterium]
MSSAIDTSTQTIYIYTDGACSGNPGRGGYGIILKAGNLLKEISGGFAKTTNNRMELMAVIKGLEALKNEGSKVVVVSDSKYVTEAINLRWLFNWEKKGWKKVKNPDLWQRLLQLYRKHDVKFEWVKGHASHPENERCDELAVSAIRFGVLQEDAGFNAAKDVGNLNFM